MKINNIKRIGMVKLVYFQCLTGSVRDRPNRPKHPYRMRSSNTIPVLFYFPQEFEILGTCLLKMFQADFENAFIDLQR